MEQAQCCGAAGFVLRKNVSDTTHSSGKTAAGFRRPLSICQMGGCGSACAAGAIVDLQTGNVFPPPLGGKGSGWDRWIFCGGVFEAPYTEYRRNSLLMILRCTKSSVKAPDLYYLVW